MSAMTELIAWYLNVSAPVIPILAYQKVRGFLLEKDGDLQR